LNDVEFARAARLKTPQNSVGAAQTQRHEIQSAQRKLNGTKFSLRSANGAEYDSQGQVPSAARHVAPGKHRKMA